MIAGWDAFDKQWPFEHTKQTPGAFEYARRVARETFEAPSFADDRTELRILPDGDVSQYVISIFGQPPWLGKQQGASEQRIGWLRDGIKVPVWIAFVQGKGEPGATTVRSGWLHVLGEAKPISLDPAPGMKRFGWHIHDLTTTGELVFPQVIPPVPAHLASLF